jgi:hypothetical protein
MRDEVVLRVCNIPLFFQALMKLLTFQLRTTQVHLFQNKGELQALVFVIRTTMEV